MKLLLALLVIAVWLGLTAGCSVENIDSRVKRQLELCEKVRDEALRVRCITAVQADK